MIEKAQEWVELHGEPPTANDWNPADCMSAARRSADRGHRWASRAARFYDGEYPWTGSVFKRFGGWNSFLKEAGLPIRYQRSRLAEETTKLEPDELRSLLDAAEAAMVAGDGPTLRASLLALSRDAMAWAEQVDD